MSTQNIEKFLRSLPSVDKVLQTEAIREALKTYPRKLVLASIRQTLERKRREIFAQSGKAQQDLRLDLSHIVELCLDHLTKSAEYTLRPVVNATGIVIHTNLGRSLLPQQAIERLIHICSKYNNLEYDLKVGRRGSRYVHAEAILCEITGAEAALIVNNNAAAVLLCLNTLAKNREVIVSRGEMVEIGGSFRIPDVMISSGAILKEVGCTNRTHISDYESAINERTSLLLKVHRSNYRIIGFTAEVSLKELVRLGRKHGIYVMKDLGSGSLIDTSRFGLAPEPTAQQAIEASVDVVTFSGDKLLGGPQAGIILGRKEIIQKCQRNPLTRALRVDKMTLAALEATLRLYSDERVAIEQIPTLRMIAQPLDALHEKAKFLATKLTEMDKESNFHIKVERNTSQVGGGSLPAQDLPTYVVSIYSPHLSAAKIERWFRSSSPPIICRIESERVLLDVRTLIKQDELDIVANAFASMILKLEELRQ